MPTEVVGSEVALYVQRQLSERDRRISALESDIATAMRNNTAQWEKINELIQTVNQHAGKLERQVSGTMDRVEPSSEPLRTPQEAPLHSDPVRVGFGKVLTSLAALLAALSTAAVGWFMGGGSGPSS